MRKILALLAVAIAAGCGSSHRDDTTPPPPEHNWIDQDRSAKDGGWCGNCHMSVYADHECKLTVPCALCKREHGARHFHEIVWHCEKCQVFMREGHICNDAKTCEVCLHTSNQKKKSCELCREGKHKALNDKACTECSRPSPVSAVQGITVWCAKCKLEVGANHVHAKTVFCGTCLREAGEGHIHDATRYCPTCAKEVALDHVHGTTVFCKLCQRDAGPGHKHGQSIWCYRCNTEAVWPHCHHAQ